MREGEDDAEGDEEEDEEEEGEGRTHLVVAGHGYGREMVVETGRKSRGAKHSLNSPSRVEHQAPPA